MSAIWMVLSTHNSPDYGPCSSCYLFEDREDAISNAIQSITDLLNEDNMEGRTQEIADLIQNKEYDEAIQLFNSVQNEHNFEYSSHYVVVQKFVVKSEKSKSSMGEVNIPEAEIVPEVQEEEIIQDNFDWNAYNGTNSVKRRW